MLRTSKKAIEQGYIDKPSSLEVHAREEGDEGKFSSIGGGKGVLSWPAHGKLRDNSKAKKPLQGAGKKGGNYPKENLMALDRRMSEKGQREEVQEERIKSIWGG